MIYPYDDAFRRRVARRCATFTRLAQTTRRTA